MVDVVTPAVRSRMMAGIQGKNTRPELVVRRILYSAGYRYRLHRRDLPGTPDLVLISRKIAVLVHGCFWHMHSRCSHSKMPSSRKKFWTEKLTTTVRRDERAIKELHDRGWRTLVIWECATRAPVDHARLERELLDWIESGSLAGEISSVRVN